MKLPAIQFYPADWRKDPGVQSLDYFDRGVWFEILCLMHESPNRGKLTLNGAAMPDEALARILGLDNQTLTKTLTTLLKYGVASRDEETGALINRRMVKDENLRQIRTEAGKKGGNPVLLNHKATTEDKQNPTTGVKQKSTPSSSSSFSSSSSISDPSSKEPKDHSRVSRAGLQGTRLPDDFCLNSEMREWAAKNAPHVDLKLALAEFVDYWRGVPGQRGRKLDWDATWRNRLRELEGRKNGGRQPKSKVEASMDAVRSVLAEYENEG